MEQNWISVKETLPEDMKELIVYKNGQPHHTEVVLVALETNNGYVYRTNCRQYYPQIGWIWDEQLHGLSYWKPFQGIKVDKFNKHESNIQA